MTYSNIYTRAKLASEVVPSTEPFNIWLQNVLEPPMSAWGPHFADGCYTEGEWFTDEPDQPSYSTTLRRLNPAYVGLLGGAQYNEARQRAQWITANLPAKVIWRHYKHIPPGGTEPKDDGLWGLPVSEWVNNIALAHGYHDTGWYVLTDNEPSMQDWTPYVNWLTDLLHYLYADPKEPRSKLRLAVLRFPTHNPPIQAIYSGVFDKALKAIKAYQGPVHNRRIIVSPNWYYSADNLDGIKHVVALVERMQAITGQRPTVVLGEYAYAHGLDAYKGWLGAGIPESVMLNHLRANYDALAKKHRFYALPYCVANIGGPQVMTFRMDRRVLSKMADIAPQVPDEWLAEDGTVPVETYREIVAELRNATTLNIRADHNTSSAVLGGILNGDTIGYLPPVTGQDIGLNRGDQWVPVRKDGIEGYVHAHYIVLPSVESPTPEPEPDPEDTQPGEATYVSRAEHQAALDRIETLERQVTALYRAVDGIVGAYGMGHVAATEMVEGFLDAETFPPLPKAS